MDIQLESSDPLTIDIVESGVVTWEDLIRCVQTFHYGRNSKRSDVSLVWSERKGSCSSKHAFLKHMADLNDIQNVDLILCMYKMNSSNTHKIEPILNEFNIDYLPEAHCYIRFGTEAIDATTMISKFSSIQADVLEEQIIRPDQVIDYKVEYHQDYMRKWGAKHHPEKSFDELWAIREKCISALVER
ncbi:MAG: hypothetical protein HRT58_08920 [Crocinitomicaceae bacterium]|nr:hypothetical protein [Flavobacteriales bacterium]NQZ35773.1 hypothetical protein [Crocinitomicaceae bacterium]